MGVKSLNRAVVTGITEVVQGFVSRHSNEVVIRRLVEVLVALKET
jgi:hypothetical protein